MYELVHSTMRGYNVRCVTTGAYMLAHWTKDKPFAIQMRDVHNNEAKARRLALGSEKKYV